MNITVTVMDGRIYLSPTDRRYPVLLPLDRPAAALLVLDLLAALRDRTPDHQEDTDARTEPHEDRR